MEDQLNAILSIVASRPAAVSAGKKSEEPPDARLVVSVDLGDCPVVSKHIFGLFLEHLGRCVYEGVWELAPEGGELTPKGERTPEGELTSEGELTPEGKLTPEGELVVAGRLHPGRLHPGVVEALREMRT